MVAAVMVFIYNYKVLLTRNQISKDEILNPSLDDNCVKDGREIQISCRSANPKTFATECCKSVRNASTYISTSIVNLVNYSLPSTVVW